MVLWQRCVFGIGIQKYKSYATRTGKKAYKCDLKSLIMWDNSSPVYDTHKEVWFCGRDVRLILGFQNIGDALTKKVKKAYKTSLHAICETHMTPDPNNEGRAVYICSAEPPGNLNLACISWNFVPLSGHILFKAGNCQWVSQLTKASWGFLKGTVQQYPSISCLLHIKCDGICIKFLTFKIPKYQSARLNQGWFWSNIKDALTKKKGV